MEKPNEFRKRLQHNGNIRGVAYSRPWENYPRASSGTARTMQYLYRK
jgi:hypothetical protein